MSLNSYDQHYQYTGIGWCSAHGFYKTTGQSWCCGPTALERAFSTENPATLIVDEAMRKIGS